MDTALRRRFSFEEMMPDTDLLKDINVMGVNISEILETINRRRYERAYWASGKRPIII